MNQHLPFPDQPRLQQPSDQLQQVGLRLLRLDVVFFEHRIVDGLLIPVLAQQGQDPGTDLFQPEIALAGEIQQHHLPAKLLEHDLGGYLQISVQFVCANH